MFPNSHRFSASTKRQSDRSAIKIVFLFFFRILLKTRIKSFFENLPFGSLSRSKAVSIRVQRTGVDWIGFFRKEAIRRRIEIFPVNAPSIRDFFIISTMIDLRSMVYRRMDRIRGQEIVSFREWSNVRIRRKFVPSGSHGARSRARRGCVTSLSHDRFFSTLLSIIGSSQKLGRKGPAQNSKFLILIREFFSSCPASSNLFPLDLFDFFDPFRSYEIFLGCSSNFRF